MFEFKILKYTKYYFDYMFLLQIIIELRLIAISTNKSVSAINLTAYPIPAINQLTVSISSEILTTSEIYIYDITGKIQSQFKENLKNGSNNIDINTTLLKAGTYFLISKTPSGSIENLKFIISK